MFQSRFYLCIRGVSSSERQETVSTSPNLPPDTPNSTELLTEQLPAGNPPRLLPLPLFRGFGEEMFTSLSLMIMPLNGWKIAQVGGGNSDSSRLITALTCILVRGQWCTCHELGSWGKEWILLGRPRNGLCKCHSWGWTRQGAGVLSAFSGCEIKAALGISSAYRLEKSEETGLAMWLVLWSLLEPLFPQV